MKAASLFTAALFATAAVHAADGDPDPGFAFGGIATRAVTAPQYQLFEPGAAQGDDGSLVTAGVAGVAVYSTAARFAVAKFLPDGSVDTNFGSAGVSEIDFSNGAADYPAYARSVARLDGGQWLVAGRVGPSFDIGLARLLPNGQLDGAYGNQGRAQVDVGGQDILLDLQIDAQQRAWLLVDSNSDVLIRFTAQGQLDASFGVGGKLVLPNDIAPLGFTRDAQGRILLGGIQFGTTHYRMAVRRLRADGSTDTSFGNQGLSLLEPDLRANAQQLRVLADGRILVVGNSHHATNWQGSSQGRLTVARLLPDGQLDTGYGANGFRVVDFGGDERGIAYPDTRIALGADGKLTLARAVIEPVAAIRLARLLPSGQPDATFAPEGKRTVLQNGYNGLTLSNVLLSPQRLLIAGTYNQGNQRVFYATAWRDGDRIFRDGLD